jgi:hypothetical protein
MGFVPHSRGVKFEARRGATGRDARGPQSRAGPSEAMRRPDLTDDGWSVDSPLEEDGFELLVRGRGEAGCRPFLAPGCVDEPARSERGIAVPRVCLTSCRCGRRSSRTTGGLFGRTHVPDAGGRERQLVGHRSERGQSVGDGVGHQAAHRDDRALAGALDAERVAR